MSKENEVICPVYFDGKTLRKDRNINSVFTSGFDVFRIMNKINTKVAEGYFAASSFTTPSFAISIALPFLSGLSP